MKNKITFKESIDIFKDIIKDKDAQINIGIVGFGIVGVIAGAYGVYNGVTTLTSPKGAGKNGERAVRGRKTLIGGGVMVASFIAMVLLEKKIKK